jgi:hypothetical protein
MLYFILFTSVFSVALSGVLIYLAKRDVVVYFKATVHFFSLLNVPNEITICAFQIFFTKKGICTSQTFFK